MSVVNLNPASTHPRSGSFWSSFRQSVMALVDGEVAPSRRITQQPTRAPAGSITFDLIDPDLINARDVYVVDYEDGLLFDQVDLVAIGAASVEARSNVEDVFSTIISMPADNLLVVVNIDTVGDIDQAVDSLFALKTARPDIPVVIASATFQKNNFTSQRRSIADASVRLPCSCAALADAIEAGVLNSKS